MDKIYDQMTLKDARSYIYQNRHDGVMCPCCMQFAKVYRRRITSSMCMGLMMLYRMDAETPDSFFHHRELSKVIYSVFKTLSVFSGGDFAKLVYWGLIEEKQKDDDDGAGRTSGYWRIRHLGRLFAENKAAVCKYVYLYDGKLVDVSEEQITIYDAINSKFNYSELMRG